MRLIISNIGTATYETAKYLAKLLSTIGYSDYTVTVAQLILLNLSKKKQYHKVISFDVKSLFTVPSEETIAIIFRKVFDKSKIMTNTPRRTMRQLSLLCTKHDHFTFNGEMYIQVDDVAMGSPLGPLLADIFMSTLEEHLITTLEDRLTHWKGYVDDTHACINKLLPIN